MPANKNAIVRYKILDELLSDYFHFYNMADLVEKVNNKLRENEYPTVCKRTIEMDLNALECDFDADITRASKNGKHYIQYSQRDFSIFHKKLSEEEKRILGEIISTLGQFDGLPHFSWLAGLQENLGVERSHPVISFSHVESLKNANLLGRLYDCVANEQVIKIRHQKFSSEEDREIIMHPYLIKEYANRWYLVGKEDGQAFFRNLSLDRILDFEPMPGVKFIPCDFNDLKAHYDRSIGISVFEDKPILNVLFWVSELQGKYVASNPAHRTLHKITDPKKLEELQAKYHHKEGCFFSIQCQQSYELERALMSHFAEIEVLEPPLLRESIKSKIKDMYELYF